MKKITLIIIWIVAILSITWIIIYKTKDISYNFISYNIILTNPDWSNNITISWLWNYNLLRDITTTLWSQNSESLYQRQAQLSWQYKNNVITSITLNQLKHIDTISYANKLLIQLIQDQRLWNDFNTNISNQKINFSSYWLGWRIFNISITTTDNNTVSAEWKIICSIFSYLNKSQKCHLKGILLLSSEWRLQTLEGNLEGKIILSNLQ